MLKIIGIELCGLLMKPKSIVFVVNVDWFFCSHRLPIALELLKSGHTVTLICSVTNKQKYIESLGISVIPIKLSRSGSSLWNELRTFIQLGKTLRNIPIDVLHLVTIKPVLYGALLSRWMDIPKRVASISGLGFIFLSTRIKYRLIKMIVVRLYRMGLNKSNTTIIFQNRDDLELFSVNKISTRAETKLIRGSGVDLNQIQPTIETDDSIVVMFMARLLKDKGVVEFIESSTSFISNSDIKFVLVGDVDPDNPNSLSTTELTSYKKYSNVEHWGWRNDISVTLSKSNIVVLPSYREGLPKSLLEAAASARSVITTDVPGCRDAIENGLTGLLVPLKNVGALVEAIELLISKPELRHKYGQAGRVLAEKEFDINSVVQKHLQIYGI